MLSDLNFATVASMANLYEIESGRLAAGKATGAADSVSCRPQYDGTPHMRSCRSTGGSMEPIDVMSGTPGAKSLEDAISFLWSEAGTILDRYHQRRGASVEAVSTTIDDPVPPGLKLPARRTIDFNKVAEREELLLDLRDELNRYRDGSRTASPDDQALLGALQQILDVFGEVYHAQAAPIAVRAVQDIGEVAASGRVVGIEAEEWREDRLESVQKVAKVEGNVIGVVKN